MKNAIKNIVATLQFGLILFQLVPTVALAQEIVSEPISDFSVILQEDGFDLEIDGQNVQFDLQAGDFGYEAEQTEYGLSETLSYLSGDVIYQIQAGDMEVKVEEGALVFYNDGAKVFTRPVATLRANDGTLLGSAQYSLLEKSITTVKSFDAEDAPENRDGYTEGPDGYLYKGGVAYEYRGGTYVRVQADWNNPSTVEGEVFGERDFTEYLTEEVAEVTEEEIAEEEVTEENADEEIVDEEVEEEIIEENTEEEITEPTKEVEEIIEEENNTDENIEEEVETPEEDVEEENTVEESEEEIIEEEITEPAEEENLIEDLAVWVFGIDEAYAQESEEEVIEEEIVEENTEEPTEEPTEEVEEIIIEENNTDENTEEVIEEEVEIAEEEIVEEEIINEESEEEGVIVEEEELESEEIAEPTIEEVAEEAIVAFEEVTTITTYTIQLNLDGVIPAEIIMPTVVLEDKFLETSAEDLVCANPALYAEMFAAINAQNTEEYVGLEFTSESIREGEAIIKTSERELSLPVDQVSEGGDLLGKAQDYLNEKKTKLESESDHFLVDALGEQVVTSTQVAKKLEESLAGTSEKLNAEKFVTNKNGRTLETTFNEASTTVEKKIKVNNNYSFDVTLRGLESYCQSVYSGINGDTKVYAGEDELITYTQGANSGEAELKEWIYALAPNTDTASRYDWDFTLDNANADLELDLQDDGSVMLYVVQHGRDGDTLTALVEIAPLVYFTAQGTEKQAEYIISGQTLSISINESAENYPLLIDPTFTLVNATTGFSARSNHASVVYDGKMWVMGGYDGSSDLQDVWFSVDGDTWVRATDAPGWHARSFATSLVFDGKMWVIAGDYGYSTITYNNDVWSSSDGINWTEETAGAGFSARSGQAGAVFDGKMWIIGGRNSAGTYLNDVWSSVDGINWVQETASAGFGVRTAHEVVTYDNKLWVIGGYNGSSQYSDAWYSADGVNWTQATASMALGGRDSHTLISYDDKLWLLGGYIGSSFMNDVWTTTDGATWTQETFTAPFTVRDNHQSVIFDDKIWVIAGKNSSRLNDSWSSVLDETAPTISDIYTDNATAPYGSTVRFYVDAADTGGSGLDTTNALFYLKVLGSGTWDRADGVVMSWDGANSRYYYDIVLNDIYNTGYAAEATVYDNIGYDVTYSETPTEFVIENTPAPISYATDPADTGYANGDGNDITLTTGAVVDADGQAVEYLFRVSTGADAETGVVCDSGWQAGLTYDCNPGEGTFYWHVYTRDTIETTTPDYVYEFVNNYSPTITDNQAGDDTVRNTAGTTYDVDASDATLGIDLIQYSLGTASGLTDIAGWQDIWTGDGASYTTDWEVNTALLAQGRNYVNVLVTDLGGLTTQLDGAFYIEWDTVAPPAPVLSSTTPTNDTTPTWTWVSGGADGNGNYRYKLDDNDMSAGTTDTVLLTYTSGVLAEGDHTLYVQERDDVGNWSPIGSYTVNIDTTDPTVTLTYGANPAPAGAMTITATFDEALAGTPQIAIDQPGTTDIAAIDMTATADPLIWTYDYTVQTATGGTYIDGTATVTISNAVDPAGNTLSTTNNPDFVIDTTAPTISTSSPSNGALLPLSPEELVFSYSDNAVDVASIAVMIDLTGDLDYDDPAENLTASCTTLTATDAICPIGATLLAGSHQMYFTISDTAGNTTTLEYLFWVDDFTFTVEHLAVDLDTLSPGIGSTTTDDTEHTLITITTYGAGVDINATISGQLTNGTDNVAWHANNVAVAGTGEAYRVKETAAGAFGNYFNFNDQPTVTTKAKLADGTYGGLLTYTFYVEHYARIAGSESPGTYTQDVAFSADLTY